MTTLLYRQESIVFWRKLAPLVGLELPVNGVNHYATVDCRICPHNWWYDLPMPMWTFLENYDFSGKTIIPFFSYEGSSNGANALPTVTKLAAGATVRSDDALSIRGGNVDGAESEVREWVRNLEY